MKKLIATLIIVAICIVSALYAGPMEIKKSVIIVKDKITVDENTGSSVTENRVADYVDDQTVKVTTTLTTTPAASAVEYNKAVLKTELDHMVDRKAEDQKRVAATLAREAELILMLEVFK